MKLFTLLFAVLFISGSSFAFDSSAGYDEKEKKDKELVLNVSGMVCGVCEDKVSKELKALKGVKEVKASHEKNKVTLVLTSDRASDEEISKAVKTAGFEIVKEEKMKDGEKEKYRDKKKDKEKKKKERRT